MFLYTSCSVLRMQFWAAANYAGANL